MLSAIEVHLVLCDLLMPQLDGYQLAYIWRNYLTPRRSFFMSAFRSDLEFDRPILTKPFKVGDLTAAVRRILEKPSRPAAGSV
jgi:CheY-like chemotaxis protein